MTSSDSRSSTTWIVGNRQRTLFKCWIDGEPGWTSDKNQAIRYFCRTDAAEACQEDECASTIIKLENDHMRNDKRDAERFRWLLAGNGYFLEENMLCGHAPTSDEERDMARKQIDRQMKRGVNK